jgi:hypothetical protein
MQSLRGAEDLMGNGNDGGAIADDPQASERPHSMVDFKKFLRFLKLYLPTI